MRSLCALALAAGEDAPLFLKSAMTAQFKEIYNHYSELVSILRQESWRYARSIKILADKSEGIAPFDIDLEIDLEILMEGRNIAWLSSNEDGTTFTCDWLAWLLTALHNKSIKSLLETFDPFGAGESLDIIVEEEVDEFMQLATSNKKVEIRGSSVVLKKTGETLFDVRAYYQNNEESLPGFVEGELQVPIYEHIGNGSRGGVNRGSNDDLGVLENLWGWEPDVLHPEIHRATWENWLSAWIMD